MRRSLSCPLSKYEVDFIEVQVLDLKAIEATWAQETDRNSIQFDNFIFDGSLRHLIKMSGRKEPVGTHTASNESALANAGGSDGNNKAEECTREAQLKDNESHGHSVVNENPESILR